MISGDACGRSGFLIHGGNCAGDPSEGCIIIQDPNIRYKVFCLGFFIREGSWRSLAFFLFSVW